MPDVSNMSGDWREANRANWDERVALHQGTPSYDLGPLRAGQGRLDPLVEAELGPVAGLRVLHLQCHFGRDSLILAQQGAEVTGVDFSAPAIAVATGLAGDLGLAARFVQSDVYAANAAVGADASFDLVFVTWGTVGWLPDIAGWARVVAGFLKPGGRLYFCDGHPAALVLDDMVPGVGALPGPLTGYLDGETLVIDDDRDYASPGKLANLRTFEWVHPVGQMVTALIDAGLRLEWLHEHDRVVWPMFERLVSDGDGFWRWPDRAWLPLSLSLSAVRG